MSSLHSFSCDNKNVSAPVLNSFRTFHVPKVKPFSLHSYVSTLSEASLRFFQHQRFYEVSSASGPTPNLEDQGIPYRLGHHLWSARHESRYHSLRYRWHSSQDPLITQASSLRQSKISGGRTS